MKSTKILTAFFITFCLLTGGSVLSQAGGDRNALDEEYTKKLETSMAEEKSRKEALIKVRTLESKESKKEIDIPWDEVEGAEKYKVEIMAYNGSMLTDKVVTTNMISISLGIGEYRMRVGAINKFEKIGAWSEWSDIKIVSRRDVVNSAGWNPDRSNFTLAAGISYIRPGSVYTDRYDTGSMGWTVQASWRLGGFSVFGDIPVLKNTALELEADNYAFKGKNDVDKIEDRLDLTIAGMNFKYLTGFRFPVNVAVRAGAGIAYTRQELRLRPGSTGTLNESGRITTTDPVYRIGLSAVFSIPGGFYIECGGGYILVDYLNDDLSGIRYFLLAGMRF